MAIVGAVEIDLVARVARLQTDLDKATGMIKGFRDKSVEHFDGMSRAAERVGSYITAMVSVAGLSMLANFTKNVSDETDALINQAKYLGISTDKLSAFQHMALLSGVSTEAITDALAKFSKNLGEAADGTGPVADKLKMLGLSIKGLQELTPDEAFLQIGEAIGKLSTASDKAAATVAIFGRSSIGLINVFDDMRGNLASATAEVDKFHLSLSKDDEKKIQALDDAFDRLGQSIKGAGRALVVEFSEGLTKMVEATTEAPNQLKEGWKGLLYAFKSGQVFTNKTLQQLAKESDESAKAALKPWERFALEMERINKNVTKKSEGDTQSAKASPGFTADQWQRVLDESEKNYQTLYGISDKFWSQIQVRSSDNYQSELDSVAISQDSQIELYRNHYANLDAEHAVHLDKWRADEEALSMDMGAVWEAQQQNEERINQIRRNSQYATFGALADLLGQFAGKSKAAAQAQLLITKAISVFQIMAATHVAAAQALATTPPYPNFALAASVEGWGAAQAALVVAGGLAQSASIAKGGGSSFSGGSSGGGTTAAGSTTSSSTTSSQQVQQPTPIVIQVNVNGSILTDNQFNEVLRDNLSEFFNNDGVLVRSGTAQARELVA